MAAAALAANIAVVVPAGIITDVGTVSRALLLVRPTVDPPAGAACVRVTVHALVALALNDAGEQVNNETDGTVMVPPVAVITTPFAPASASRGFDI
jgi:hypothetical protein